MTVTETFKKALVCFEDFIPDFCDKMVQDGVIDESVKAQLVSDLYLKITKCIAETTYF